MSIKQNLSIKQNFNNLNFDLYSKACIKDPTCSCGSDNEDARHYFLRCPNYDITSIVAKFIIA